MLPYQKRVIQEKKELDKKLTKLDEFRGGSLFEGLVAEEQCRLERQSFVMAEYSRVLGERIAAFQIMPC